MGTLKIGDKVYVGGRGRTEVVPGIKLPEGRKEEMDWADVSRGGRFITLELEDGTKVKANMISRWD